ncbi:MAG TPA: hypothetical protein VK956_20815 [Verrucomicrobium sp.]|nr:hypothetical protein [Verrucomicrobium sp.]
MMPSSATALWAATTDACTADVSPLISRPVPACPDQGLDLH